MLRIRIAAPCKLEYELVRYTMPVPVRGLGRGPTTATGGRVLDVGDIALSGVESVDEGAV